MMKIDVVPGQQQSLQQVSAEQQGGKSSGFQRLKILEFTVAAGNE